MKKIALLAVALTVVPAMARAQEHQHEMKQDTQAQHMHMMMQQHEQFVQSLIDKRAELNLTADQVTKLEAFKTKMAAHHKAMMQNPQMMKQMMMQHDSARMSMMKHDTAGMAGMKHDGAKMAGHGTGSMEDAMHKELMDIFTPAQRVKVDSLMKAQMKTCMSSDMKCSMK